MKLNWIRPMPDRARRWAQVNACAILTAIGAFAVAATIISATSVDTRPGGEIFFLVGDSRVSMGLLCGVLCLGGSFAVGFKQILLSPKVEGWPGAGFLVRSIMFVGAAVLFYAGTALIGNVEIQSRVRSPSLVIALGVHTVLQFTSLYWIASQRAKSLLEKLQEAAGLYVFSGHQPPLAFRKELEGVTGKHPALGADIPEPQKPALH